MEKRFSIKSYSPDGTFLKNWPNATFLGFSKELNAGAGECEIELNAAFDYAGSDLQLGNRIDVYVADLETIGTIDGEKLIYRGYVSAIMPRTGGRDENVAIRIIGYYTKMSVDFLKNAAQTTLYTDENDGLTITSPGTAADIGLIARAIIDRYRAETGDGSIRYTLESIPEVGETALYSFKRKTYREALDKIKDMAPAGYHWYVGADGVVHFEPKGSGNAHSLAIGREISSIKVERSMETLRNVILIWNGEPAGPSAIYAHYEDAGSIARYGRRASAIVDPGIGDAAAAASLAARFLADMRDPDVKIIMEVNDSNGGNGYDIESIEPGDTITVLNFDSANAETIRSELAVTRIDYRPDGATIEAALVRTGIIEGQENAKRRLEAAETIDIPESYS